MTIKFVNMYKIYKILKVNKEFICLMLDGRNNMLKKKIFGIAAAGILAASTFAACGNGGSKTEETTAAETTTAAESGSTDTQQTATFDITKVTAADIVENGTVGGTSPVDGSKVMYSKVVQNGQPYEVIIGSNANGEINQLLVLENATSEPSTNPQGVPGTTIKGTDIYTKQEFTFGLANDNGKITIVTPASENNTYEGSIITDANEIAGDIAKAAPLAGAQQ